METPRLFDDPNQERLGLVVAALVAEVSVLADRLAALQAVAEERGLFSEADVETYLPDDARSETWQKARQDLIGRVFEPLRPQGDA